MHVALGGCLKPPPISYGITQDTGGHVAYVLGAASAQAASDPSTRVSIVTRAFDEPALGEDHARAYQPISTRLCIRRLRTADPRYLTKSALALELPALRRAFLALLEKDLPDVIHAHFADAAELALAAARRHGIPVLYTPHSLALDKRRCREMPAGPGDDVAARLARERRAIAEADAIIVSSDDEVRRQVRAYDPTAVARSVVVRPGVQLRQSVGTELASALIDPFLDDPRRPFLLAIARPVPKKNLPQLLDAYGASARLRRRANLVILAGQHERVRAERDEQTIELERLHALVARHGLGGSVALPPSHAPETVTQLYRLAVRRHGVFVNPAKHEPFGLTLIEAAHFGLPVIATRHGGPRDILANLGHGRLVEPDDRAAIVAACEALLDDPSAYAAASRSASRRIGLYSWDGWAASVGEVVERVRASRRRSAVHAPRGRVHPARVVTAPANASTHAVADALSGALASVVARTSARAVIVPDHFLAFDIDDTLTGCPEGVRLFRRWISARPPGALPYALATGRELPDAIRVIGKWRLPWPDVWLTSVGTEIWRPSEAHGLVRCGAYARRLSEGWNRDAIVRALRGLNVRYQGDETQRLWKVSLFGDASDATAVEETLAAASLDVHVIASHGRFIDVVPRRAGKASAIEFEAARRGIPMARCVSAGDSGNDADMLHRCGKAILVANALPEIAGIVARAGLHRASTRHAHGVLEGLAAFGLPGAGQPRLARGGTAA